MIKRFSVNIETNDSGRKYVDIFSRDVVGFGWLEGFAEDLGKQFGYQLVRRFDGPDHAVWQCKAGDKKIELLYDIAFGVEIDPMTKSAEEDVESMWRYFKGALESLPDDGPPPGDEN